MRLRHVGRRMWLVCVATLVAIGGGTAWGGVGGSSVIVSRQTIVGGLTYPQWEAKAWQWEIANVRFLASHPPAVPRCTTAGQRGPVWFLHGDNYQPAGSSITRSCTIPAGRYLFIDAPSNECSTVEPPPYHATTDPGLRRCARSFGPVSSMLTLDGRRIAPSGFVVATAVFRFTMPPRNNYLQVPGATHGRGAAYGQGLMLRPLTDGPHTLVRVARYHGGLTLRSTYHLTVG